MAANSNADRTEQVEYSPFQFFKRRGSWPKEQTTLPMQWKITADYWRSLGSSMFVPVLIGLFVLPGEHPWSFDLFVLPLIFIPFIFSVWTLWNKHRFGDGVITLSAFGFRDTRLSDIFIPWSACRSAQLSGNPVLKTTDVGDVIILTNAIPDLERRKFYGFSSFTWPAAKDRLLFIEFRRDWTSREMFAVHALIASLIEKSHSDRKM